MSDYNERQRTNSSPVKLLRRQNRWDNINKQTMSGWGPASRSSDDEDDVGPITPEIREKAFMAKEVRDLRDMVISVEKRVAYIEGQLTEAFDNSVDNSVDKDGCMLCTVI